MSVVVLSVTKSAFLGMCDSVDDDVSEVVVDESVENFTSVALALNNSGGLEDAEMLADQRLGNPECTDQFVDAALGFT